MVFLGCSAPFSNRSPRPGDGLREYQRLTLDLRRDVTALKTAVEALSAASPKGAASAYAKFDRSLHRLEVFSIKARAKADAIEQRGEAYFEEWAGEIGGARTGPATEKGPPQSAAARRDRFVELRGHFERILNDSRQVRQECRAFLDSARRLRRELGSRPTPQAIELARSTMPGVTATAQRSVVALDHLMTTLKSAEAALRAGPVPLSRVGDKP